MQAIDFVTSQPWLITAEALELLVSITERSHEFDAEKIEALAAKRARSADNGENMRMRDGTAIIPVTGPIFRRANLFSRISGATSTDLLALDLRTAIEDPEVQSILLDIDSPGGAAQGMHELGEMIFDARGIKPIRAYSGGQVASAAYWIGSATDELVIDRTAVAGSIGAVSTIQDTKQRDAKAGVRTIEIVSSQSPDKRVDLDTDEGRAKVQKIVDDLAGVFVEIVARNRGVDVDTVLSDFGRGGLMLGQEAVNAGLVDRLGSFETVLAELQAAHKPTDRRVFFMSSTVRQKAGAAAAARGPITVSTTDELRTALADGHTAEEITIQAVDVEAIRTEARDQALAAAKPDHEAALAKAREEGVQAERKRVTELQAITVKGYEDTVAKAISEGSTVEATSIAINKAQRSRGSLSAIAGEAPAPAAHGGQGAAPTASSGWDKITTRANARQSRKAAGRR
jgi:signal peptide peptidase SppA